MFSISTMASSTRMPVLERDREQAHHVEREAEDVHDPESWKDRQRQGDRRDDGGSEVTQEQEHHDDREDGALVEGMHRRVVVAERVGDRGIDQLELDLRVAALMASILAATASATTTSLAPFARRMLTPTTGVPLKRAKVRGSAMGR